MERTLRIARCAGAVGFIVARWLLGVCNVAVLCGWLAVASALFAAVYAAALLNSPVGFGASVLGPRGARLLALTCALHLVSAGFGVLAPERFAWRMQLVDAVDLLAWAWVLYAAPASARRFLDGESSLLRPPASPVRPRHAFISAVIVFVLLLQLSALFRDRPTLWPFIDYPLYSAAQTTAVRAVHYRFYGVPAHGTPTYLEITAEALGMSWFVYHTELIPGLFDRPGSVPPEFRRALANADLPPLERIEAERTTYVLEAGRIAVFPERRRLAVESITVESNALPARGSAARHAAGTRPR